MMTLKDAIDDAVKNKTAIGHFNISEFAALRGISHAAQELGVPVIIGTSEGEAEFIGIQAAAALVKTVREKTRHPIFLNADHIRKPSKVKDVSRAKYDMLIFDGAQMSFKKNVKSTKKAVSVAKKINPDILVEGELGYIGTSSKLLDDIPEGVQINKDSLVKPDKAAEFVRETGIDLFAPAVGNIHGMMKGAKNPNLDIERIREIKSATGVPLVLHGGSGVTDDDFISAIDAGVAIIHINTEIRVAWRRGIEEGLKEDKDRIAPYKILSDPGNKFSDPEEEIYKVVLRRLKLFSRL